MRFWLCITLVTWLSCCVPSTAFVSESLDTAKQTDFFKFFHLSQEGEQSLNKTKVVTFKPSGEKFRKLITVTAVTDEGGKIQDMKLAVARTFLDDRQTSMFARDICKSFLLSAVDTQHRDSIKPVAEEIMTRDLKTVVLTAQPAAELPAQPSEIFKTIAGQSKDWQEKMSDRKLLIHNDDADGGWLIMSVAKE
jgi:hypothetical protein